MFAFPPRNLIIAGLAGCALVLADAGPVTFDLFGSQPAFAKNGKSGGASSQPGSAPGKSGSAPGHNKPSAAPSVTVEKASAPGKVAAKEAKAKGLDAGIGALHAVNADLQAFIHANPNSRVGRIAAYAMAAVGAENAAAARDAAQEIFDQAATVLGDATAAHDAALQALVAGFGYADTSSAALLANQATLTTIDPTLLTPAEADELAAINLALGSEQALSEATTAFDGANQTLIDAEQDLADAEGVATDALNAAANKPVDPEVQMYVNAKLEEGGIFDYYRSQDPTVIVE